MNMKHSMPKVAILCACVAALAGCACAPHERVGESKPIMRRADDGAGCYGPARRHNDELSNVIKTECAFAKTMADRKFKAFASFLDDAAVFFNKDGALLGKDAVLKEWKPYFDAAAAPFSWEPTRAEGSRIRENLAYTTGPVYDASGTCVARFNSIWRKHDDGHWRIVFDKGDGKCDPTVIPGGGKSD